jgi:hypothetical protein
MASRCGEPPSPCLPHLHHDEHGMLPVAGRVHLRRWPHAPSDPALGVEVMPESDDDAEAVAAAAGQLCPRVA